MSDDLPVEPRLDAAFARAWVGTFAALFAEQAQLLGTKPYLVRSAARRAA